jgi:hypothetical protein
MKPAEGPELPTVLIGLHDLVALRSILSGYLAYLRRTTPCKQERQRLMQVLEGVYQRLTGISSQAMEAHFSECDGDRGGEYCHAWLYCLCAPESGTVEGTR